MTGREPTPAAEGAAPPSGPSADGPPAGERGALIRNKAIAAARAWGRARRLNWLERLLGCGRRRGRHVTADEIADRIRDVQAQTPEFTFGEAAARADGADAHPTRGPRRHAR